MTANIEDLIYEILIERPASSETISVITHLPSNLIINKLKKMQKWGKIEPVTKKTVQIWGAKRVNTICGKCSQSPESES